MKKSHAYSTSRSVLQRRFRARCPGGRSRTNPLTTSSQHLSSLLEDMRHLLSWIGRYLRGDMQKVRDEPRDLALRVDASAAPCSSPESALCFVEGDTNALEIQASVRMLLEGDLFDSEAAVGRE